MPEHEEEVDMKQLSGIDVQIVHEELVSLELFESVELKRRMSTSNNSNMYIDLLIVTCRLF